MDDFSQKNSGKDLPDKGKKKKKKEGKGRFSENSKSCKMGPPSTLGVLFSENYPFPFSLPLPMWKILGNLQSHWSPTDQRL